MRHTLHRLPPRTGAIDALHADLKRRVAELEWLREISRRLTEARSRAEVLDIVYWGVREGLGYDRVGINLFDHQAGVFEDCIGTDAQGQIVRPMGRTVGLAPDSPIWRFPGIAALLRGAEFYYTEDAAGECPPDLHYLFDGLPAHNLMVPLRSTDRVTGMISVDNLLSGRPFGPGAAGPLQALANQVGTAVENARLHEREEAERLQAAAVAERLRTVYATMACGVVVHDATGKVIDANEAAQDILGQPLERMQGRQLAEFFMDATREDGTPFPVEERSVAVALRTGRPQRGVVLAATRADGRRLWLQIDAVPMRGADGQLEQVVVSFVDITARKQAEDTLRRSEARLGVLLESARALNSTLDRDRILQELATRLVKALNARGAAFTQVDLNTRLVTSLAHYSAPGRPSIFAGGSETLDNFPVLEGVLHTRTLFHGCIDDPDFPDSERAYLRRWDMKAELLVPLVVQGVASGVLDIYWDQPLRIDAETIALCTAIAEQAAVALEHASLYAAAAERAERDPLTGLANHRSLLNQIDLAVEAGAPFALLLLDVDNFKLFNDTYGHPMGDHVLRGVADTLRDVCRADDVAARYGGDEFAVLLRGAGTIEATAVAKRLSLLMHALAQTAANGTVVPVTVSVGVSCFPQDGLTRPELVVMADQAMYAAKRGEGHSRTRQAADLLGNSPFGVLEGLVNAVDAKDRYTREHSEDVTQWALLLARALGLGAEEQRVLAVAGPLHDVGKIAVPDRILRKPGRLSPEEYDVIKQHVAYGVAIIRGVLDDAAVVDAVAHHHERWDGRGYPCGAPGPDTPLLGRIMQVADAVSAMTMNRPYRQALGWKAVLAALRDGAGRQFDPELVEVLIAATAAQRAAS